MQSYDPVHIRLKGISTVVNIAMVPYIRNISRGF